VPEPARTRSWRELQKVVELPQNPAELALFSEVPGAPLRTPLNWFRSCEVEHVKHGHIWLEPHPLSDLKRPGQAQIDRLQPGRLRIVTGQRLTWLAKRADI
jgi:hypothetical protein